MKRISKYLNKTFDNNWTCTHVGIASVQGKRAKWAGHRNYYYIFERRTSDDKADKLIRLNCGEAAKVYRGVLKVEDIANARQAKGENKFARKVSYHFNDRARR